MSVNIEKYKEQNSKREEYLSYKKMPHEFRPYVMFVNSPDYKSTHVNTDNLGFRKTISKEGKIIDINKVKNEKICNVLMGGSTAFGMGASSDKTTISSFMSQSKIFCHNFGVRAATSQQELLIFQNFKRLLPKIKNVFILTGINDLALAAEKKSFFYPEFGGLYSEDIRLHQFWTQYLSFNSTKWQDGKNKLFFAIDYLCNKFTLFRYLFSFLSSIIPASNTFKRNKIFSKITFEEKIDNLKDLISNDISSWKAFADRYEFRIIYILQPGITWVDKKLSENESFIYENQRAVLGEKYYDKFMNKKIYMDHKKFLEEKCLENKIEFIDSNIIFQNFPKNEDLFTDLCHLTDKGNKYLAKYLCEKYE